MSRAGAAARLAGVLSLALGLGACGSAPPAPPAPDRFYRLPAPTSMAAGKPLVAGVLRVQPMRAEGLHGERAVLYSDSGDALRLEQASNVFWAEAPPRLIQRYIIAYLRAGELAPMVVDESVREADFEVRGRILQFERVLDGDGEAVDLALVLRLETGYGRPVLVEEYRRRRAVAGGGSASAGAFAAALDAVLEAFIADARRALAAAELARR